MDALLNESIPLIEILKAKLYLNAIIMLKYYTAQIFIIPLYKQITVKLAKNEFEFQTDLLNEDAIYQ